MATLKFKNSGSYCDEASSRYVATLNENINLRLWKCNYIGEWVIALDVPEGWAIDEWNGNNTTYFADTKKELLAMVREDVEEIIAEANEHAVKLRKDYKEYHDSKLSPSTPKRYTIVI